MTNLDDKVLQQTRDDFPYKPAYLTRTGGLVSLPGSRDPFQGVTGLQLGTEEHWNLEVARSTISDYLQSSITLITIGQIKRSLWDALSKMKSGERRDTREFETMAGNKIVPLIEKVTDILQDCVVHQHSLARSMEIGDKEVLSNLIDCCKQLEKEIPAGATSVVEFKESPRVDISKRVFDRLIDIFDKTKSNPLRRYQSIVELISESDELKRSLESHSVDEIIQSHSKPQITADGRRAFSEALQLVQETIPAIKMFCSDLSRIYDSVRLLRAGGEPAKIEAEKLALARLKAKLIVEKS